MPMVREPIRCHGAFGTAQAAGTTPDPDALRAARARWPCWPARCWPALPRAWPSSPSPPGTARTAQQVAQAGVPLSELAPNAPDSHTVQERRHAVGHLQAVPEEPWRWPELWGMNLDQIRNPHLIYPGQVLVLEKAATAPGCACQARRRRRGADETVKLSPRVRSDLLANGAIAAIPLHLIGPFLTEAVIFDDDELERAPRIVRRAGTACWSRAATACTRAAAPKRRAGETGSGASSGCSASRSRCTTPTPRNARLRSALRRHGASSCAARTASVPERNGTARELPVPATLAIISARREAERRRPAGAGAGARPGRLRAAPAGRPRSTAAWSRSTATGRAPARTRSSR